MNSKSTWHDQVPENNGSKNPINDIAFSPGICRICTICLSNHSNQTHLQFLCRSDGTRVIVAVGSRVLLYNAENGDLIDSLRGIINCVHIARLINIIFHLFPIISAGHKDTVNCVDFSSDGSKFASGLTI